MYAVIGCRASEQQRCDGAAPRVALGSEADVSPA